jgi:hypothetical protein
MTEKKTEIADDSDIDHFVETLRSNFSGEIDSLASLVELTEQVEKKLAEIYKEKFPKTCRSCERVYNTREEYLKATFATEKQGVLWDSFVNKVQEYRNCVCGSTLMMMVPDRRDMSEFGIKRRRLFNLFSDKIVEITGQDRLVVEAKVREIFRRIGKKTAMPKQDNKAK